MHGFSLTRSRSGIRGAPGPRGPLLALLALAGPASLLPGGIPVAAATTQAPAPAGDALPDLETRRWRQRVLVLDTPATTHPAYQAQAAALLPHWPGLIERDLHLITREGAPAFRVRLVGKDGGVKLDAREPVTADSLFALIDAMPMRRAEMRERPARREDADAPRDHDAALP